jgi:hypothetical protein
VSVCARVRACTAELAQEKASVRRLDERLRDAAAAVAAAEDTGRAGRAALERAAAADADLAEARCRAGELEVRTSPAHAHPLPPSLPPSSLPPFIPSSPAVRRYQRLGSELAGPGRAGAVTAGSG